MWEIWNTARPDRMAAALAFFGMFSFVPLLYVGLTVAGFILSDSVIIPDLLMRIQRILGPETTEFIRMMLVRLDQQRSNTSFLFSLISLGVLLFVASGLFTTLQDMLNMIWGSPLPAQQGVFAVVQRQFLAFVLVIAVGVAFVVMTAASFMLSLLEALVELQSIATLANHAVPFLLTMLAFALIYRVLARVKPSWRALWLGAFAAAVLFTLGKWLFGLYLQFGTLDSAFAAASTLAVLLLAIYYSALIFLVGAMLIRVAPLLWEIQEQ